MASSQRPGSEAVTDGVRVRVEVAFSPDASQLTADAPLQYVFTYTITVTNDTRRGVTLLARHWVITDQQGAIEHVRGPGVHGLQPSLQQGQSFTYSSMVQLPTSAGLMHGEYLMEWEDGTRFEATIPPFALVTPDALQ